MKLNETVVNHKFETCVERERSRKTSETEVNYESETCIESEQHEHRNNEQPVNITRSEIKNRKSKSFWCGECVRGWQRRLRLKKRGPH